MRRVSFYHRETGLFNGTHLTVSGPEMVRLNTPADHIAIDGHHDALSRRVDVATGQVVDYRPAPNVDREKAAAAAIVQARTAELERLSGPLVRRLVLGDESARAALQAIEDEVRELGCNE